MHGYTDCLSALVDWMRSFLSTLCHSQLPHPHTHTHTHPQKSSSTDSEFELMCALTNDAAFHMEQMLQLADTCSQWWLRDKDATMQAVGRLAQRLFEPAAAEMLRFGQECMQRIVSVVMGDVRSSLLDRVLTREWCGPPLQEAGDEAEQDDGPNGGGGRAESFVDTAVCTVSDYLKDLDVYLLPFWKDQLRSEIANEMVVGYAHALLFGSPSAQPGPAEGRASSFFSMFSKKKGTAAAAAAAATGRIVPMDDTALQRLAADLNGLRVFLERNLVALSVEDERRGQLLADHMALLCDVQLMLMLATGESAEVALAHAVDRVRAMPAAAQVLLVCL